MHPFATPLKHQKTLRFFDVFRGLEKWCIGKIDIIQAKCEIKILLLLLKLIQRKLKRYSNVSSKKASQHFDHPTKIKENSDLFQISFVLLYCYK